MKIILCDLNPRLVAEWQRAFGKVSNVEMYCSDIFEHKADCIVSPANSYGLMDGGIDAAYTKFFGPDLQKNLQSLIKELPMRELLVGQTLVVPTNNPEIPFLISAPTMRIPLDVHDTPNPYLAFKAVLIAARINVFNSILCPGLGTLTGNVSPEDCARQMYLAYKDFTDKYPTYPTSVREAYLNHKNLVGVVNMKRSR